MSNISKIEINQLSTLHAHTGPVHKIIKGRKENELISCGGDGWAISWNIHQGAESELIYRADSPILSAIIDDQTNQLILGDKSGVLHFYSFENNTLIRQVFHHPAGVVSLLSSSIGIYSCGADGKVSLWNTETGQVEKSIHVSRNSLIGCGVASSGKFITANAKGTVYVLEGKLDSISKSYNFSHGDITAISTFGDNVFIGFVSGKVIGFSIIDEKPVCESDPHWFSVTDFNMQDGETIVSVGADGKINVLDKTDLKTLGVWPEDPETKVCPAINTVFVKKDKCYIGCDDRTIKVYKTEKPI